MGSASCCEECEAFCLKPYRHPDCEIGELEKEERGEAPKTVESKHGRRG